MLKCLLSLIKVRISALVALSGYAGYALNGGSPFDSGAFLLLAFIFLSSGGSGAVNQAIEVEEDSKMARTMNRPVVTGDISRPGAMLLGASLTVVSSVAMYEIFNPTVGLLSLLTFVLYNFVYTPLKKITPLAVVVGTLPGALPVLGGGLAANPQYVSSQLILLFLILIVWQIPHFIGLSVFFKNDYELANFKIGYSDQNRAFFNLLLAVSLPLLVFLSLKLVMLKPNIFGFFIVCFSLISSVVSSLYMLAGSSRDAGLNTVKNLSIYLITIIFAAVLS